MVVIIAWNSIFSRLFIHSLSLRVGTPHSVCPFSICKFNNQHCWKVRKNAEKSAKHKHRYKKWSEKKRWSSTMQTERKSNNGKTFVLHFISIQNTKIQIKTYMRSFAYPISMWIFLILSHFLCRRCLFFLCCSVHLFPLEKRKRQERESQRATDIVSGVDFTWISENGFINEIYARKNGIVGACHNDILCSFCSLFAFFSSHWLHLLSYWFVAVAICFVIFFVRSFHSPIAW